MGGDRTYPCSGTADEAPGIMGLLEQGKPFQQLVAGAEAEWAGVDVRPFPG